MRLVVTGATGLLGSDLCLALRNRHHITGWVRKPKESPVELELVDITNPQAVDSSFKRLRPDGVIHTAAMSDVDACEIDAAAAVVFNAKGVENVARSSASVGAFLVHISTDYVFDGRLNRAYREEDPTSPIQSYGRSKLEGEQAALKENPRCLILRVSGLFGSSRPNFVLTCARRFLAGEKVPVVTEHEYSPSYTCDLAEGIERLLSRIEQDPQAANPGGPVHGQLHLANAGGATRLEVAQEIARIIHAPASLIEKTSWAALNRPAKRPANSRLDCRRFSDLTGFALRPWGQAVHAFLRKGTC